VSLSRRRPLCGHACVSTSRQIPPLLDEPDCPSRIGRKFPSLGAPAGPGT
jgi:hypothetical protein